MVCVLLVFFFTIFLLRILYHRPANDPLMSKHVATLNIRHVLAVFDLSYYEISVEQISSAN